MNFKIVLGMPGVESTAYEEMSIEEQYLALGKRVLQEGEIRNDRTGTGTKAIFDASLSHDMRVGFPLLTTKKVAWNTIVQEQLWFWSGSTDSKVLESQGIKIWAGNSSSEFLSQRGLNWREGDIGAAYGHQFRNAGAEYLGCDQTEKNGVDQLENLISDLKLRPHSRRHIMTSWAAGDINKMALPPCHSLPIQFYVSNEGWLDCKMYQRSADYFLGLPFNIAGTALFHEFIGSQTGYKPRYLKLELGDVHIYLDHVEKVKTQLERIPFHLPKLTLDDCDLHTVTPEHIHLHNYQCHPTIAGKMSI